MKKNYDFKKHGIASKASVLNETNNAVMYTRVSTKEQEDNNLSLTTQHRIIEESASKYGYSIIERFGGKYESAAKDERIEFQRMLKFIKQSKIKISYILVYAVDRFSRTGANAIYISEELRKQGVSVVSVTQPVDTSTATGVLQQNIQFLFSKYENDVRRQRTMAGTFERLSRGDWCGQAPVGYDNVTISGQKKVVINSNGQFIRKAFLMKCDQCLDNIQIMDRLGAMGYKTTLKRLQKIFRNPFYCGRIAHASLNGEVVKGNHETLISEEVFIRVNELMDMKTHGYHKIENDSLPMKSFIKCSVCNGPMTGYENRKKKIYYYKCNTPRCSNNINVKVCHQQFQTLLSSFTVSTMSISHPTDHPVSVATDQGVSLPTDQGISLSTDQVYLKQSESCFTGN